MSPSCQIAPTPAAWGRPSGRMVPRNQVSVSLGSIVARASCGRLHGSSALPYRSRFFVSVGLRSVISVSSLARSHPNPMTGWRPRDHRGRWSPFDELVHDRRDVAEVRLVEPAEQERVDAPALACPPQLVDELG